MEQFLICQKYKEMNYYLSDNHLYKYFHTFECD